MSWYFLETNNREIRTLPHVIGANARRIQLLSWTKIWDGQSVQPGDILAMAVWDDGTTTTLVAPAACSGVVLRTMIFDPLAQAFRPSQTLLILV